MLFEINYGERCNNFIAYLIVVCFLRNTCLLQFSEEKDEVWSVGEEFEKRKRNDSQGL
jgi:hypothetical protein